MTDASPQTPVIVTGAASGIGLACARKSFSPKHCALT